MTVAGRVLSTLTRCSLCRGLLSYETTANLRGLTGVRTLSQTQMLTRARKREDDDDEELNKPIKFSTSKGSHRHWNVERSFGSGYQRPLWKVIPVSLLTVGFLLWCVTRGESGIDQQLEKNLYEHLPGLLSDEEEDDEEEIPNKSS